MNTLRSIAVWIVYIQFIIGGLWLCLYLFDRVFESAIKTAKIQRAFISYMIQYWRARNRRPGAKE